MCIIDTVKFLFFIVLYNEIVFYYQVTWEVTGPDPGFEREDILQSTLQGVLTFDDQQTSVPLMNNNVLVTPLSPLSPSLFITPSCSPSSLPHYSNNFITVTVLTIEGPEPEENFTITLTAATKGVAIDEDGQTALLTVSTMIYIMSCLKERQDTLVHILFYVFLGFTERNPIWCDWFLWDFTLN